MTTPDSDDTTLEFKFDLALMEARDQFGLENAELRVVGIAITALLTSMLKRSKNFTEPDNINIYGLTEYLCSILNWITSQIESDENG